MGINQPTTMTVQREVSKKKVAVEDKISGKKNGHGLDNFPFLTYSCTLFIYLFIYLHRISTSVIHFQDKIY